MIGPIEPPLCAVCGVRVLYVELVFSPAANRGLGGHAVVAHCHGEREVVDISEHDLASMVPGSVRAGVAFQRREPPEVDLRDAMFRLLETSPPRGDEHAYAAHAVRRYEPPEGS
jgi:hypothetical protein